MSETITDHSSSPPLAPAGCLLRLVWTIAGIAAVYLSLALIVSNRPGLPSHLDAIVGVSLVLMLSARWFDITRFGGHTLSNTPATVAHFRRYAVLLVFTTLAAWTISHLLAGSFSG